MSYFENFYSKFSPIVGLFHITLVLYSHYSDYQVVEATFRFPDPEATIGPRDDFREIGRRGKLFSKKGR